MHESNNDPLIRRLRDPFPRDKIKFRPGATTKDKTKGLALAYADARTFQDRLDEVWGVDNWESHCVTNDGGCICSITLHFHREDGTSFARTKSDGAGATDVEGEKGAISDAFKRACVQWGIGRYLYSLSDMWVPLSNGKYIADPDKIKLPDWALPSDPENAIPTGKSIGGKVAAAEPVVQKSAVIDRTIHPVVIMRDFANRDRKKALQESEEAKKEAIATQNIPLGQTASVESFSDDSDPRLKRMIAIILAIRSEFADGAEHRIEGWCSYYSVDYPKAFGYVDTESIHVNERDKALANLVQLQKELSGDGSE